MKKFISLVIYGLVIFSAILAYSQEGDLLLDDFEGEISSQTVDFGGGSGSSINVSASNDIVHSGKQSIKIDYDSVSGGYMWAARGYTLDVAGAAKWLKPPQDITWQDYKGFSFYIKGEANKALIAVDIKDAQNEMFRYLITDDSKEWKRQVCPFDAFMPRGDWQPSNAQTNAVLDFPVMSFQFEVRSIGKGSFYIDKVELTK